MTERFVFGFDGLILGVGWAGVGAGWGLGLLRLGWAGLWAGLVGWGGGPAAGLVGAGGLGGLGGLAGLGGWANENSKLMKI